MADWLEIANTFINLQTLQRVGEISFTQQQVASQTLAAEAKRERDNALLSQLVDIVVNVRQLLQSKQYFDALLTAGLGLAAFKQLYSRIVNAETRLKASDIQVKLLEGISQMVTDTFTRTSIETALVKYLSRAMDSIHQILTDSNSYQLIWSHPAEEEIRALEMCDKFFSDEFLFDNLGSVHEAIREIYLHACEETKALRTQTLDEISRLKEYRESLKRSRKKPRQIEEQDEPGTGIKRFAYIAISVVLFLITLSLLSHC